MFLVAVACVHVYVCLILSINMTACKVLNKFQPIRLVNGTNRCSGRVEIYYSSQWGTVCDDRWGMQEATVACREMNCGNALSVKYKTYFGRGQDQIWLDKMECTGHEMFLADCPHKGFGVYDCNHSEYAGLVCSGKTGCILIRLINGTDSCSGRVEVFHDGRWGKLCSNNWGLKEAAVLCKELNCGDPKNSKDIFYFGDSSLQGFTSRCSDNVNSISQGHCQRSAFALLILCRNARLTGGSTHCDGRVEYFNKGQWGTVCAESWDMNDATVVCRQLDCGKPHKLIQLGPGTGNIWTDQINCNGEESTLTQCPIEPSHCNNTVVAGSVSSPLVSLSVCVSSLSLSILYFPSYFVVPHHVCCFLSLFVSPSPCVNSIVYNCGRLNICIYGFYFGIGRTYSLPR
uniref:SRCR domain-containing protein n=1 Tax=Maylandia zebra TaxID=106582 RepID=A0A3P9CH51_9CICH